MCSRPSAAVRPCMLTPRCLHQTRLAARRCRDGLCRHPKLHLTFLCLLRVASWCLWVLSPLLISLSCLLCIAAITASSHRRTCLRRATSLLRRTWGRAAASHARRACAWTSSRALRDAMAGAASGKVDQTWWMRAACGRACRRRAGRGTQPNRGDAGIVPPLRRRSQQMTRMYPRPAHS